MSINPQQIGQSGESKLLYSILKKLDAIFKTGGSSSGLTNTELRATPVPVSGTITVSNPTAQGLTDTQLRATALPVSIASMPSTPVTGTFYQATQPVSVASLPLPTSAATAANQATEITALGQIHSDLIAALPAGSNTIGKVNINNNSNGTGGLTPFKLISAASTNATSVKSSAGNLYNIVALGLTSSVRYLKIYNKASAPTVGTDTPVLTIPIPGNTQGAGVAVSFNAGINFSLGIAFAITAGVADSDVAAVAASDVVLNLIYA